MMEIYEATAGDIPVLSDLWLELIDFHEGHNPVFSLKENPRNYITCSLKERLKTPETVIFVADEDDVTIGFIIASIVGNESAFLYQRKGYIAETVVASRFRNRGIGDQLFRKAEKWLISRGADHIELQVSVKNPGAMKFWAAHGFSPATSHMVKIIEPLVR